MTAAMLFLVTALANAIWQPALIAAIAWLALKLSRCSNATTRHAVWSLALVASVVVPLASALPVVLPPSTAIATANASAAGPLAAHRLAPLRTTPIAGPATSTPAFPAVHRPSLRVQPTLAVVASVVWLVIAVAIVVRLLVSFVYLERLKRDALPLGVEERHALSRYDRAAKGDRDVRVCISEEITVPVAVGIFDAMILLPNDLVRELDANDLDRILLHELAHVRRSDDWVNLFERVAQALYFFSPGIYWISRQMDLEREVACDDWVLEQSAENVPYARCLARIVEMTQWPYAAPAAPGVFVTRRSMSIRIERLLARGRDVRIRLALVPTLLSLVLIAGIVILGGFASPTIAYTIDHPATVTHALAHLKEHRAKAVATVEPAQAAAIAPATPPPTPSLRTSVAATVGAATAAAATAATSSTAPGKVVADMSYLDEVAAMGFKNVTPDEVIQMRSVGVDLAFVQGLRDAGIKDLTPRESVELKSVGVTGDYIRSLSAQGIPPLDARSYVEMRSVGVDGAYVQAMKSAGLTDLSSRSLVQLKALDVDGDYIRGINESGLGALSAADYGALRSIHVDGTYIAQLRAAGLTGFDAHELMALKTFGVTPEYLKDLADAGYRNLSVRDVEQLRTFRIDGAYIRMLAAHGFTHLSVADLLRYKTLRIEPK